MKTYPGPHGYTYYRKDGTLYGAPTLQDGGFQEDAEIPVADFAEPLMADQLADIEQALA